jgi:hypothetical protein
MRTDAMIGDEQNYEERRAHTRHNVGSAVELKVSIGILGSKPTDGDVLDISRGGAKIHIDGGAYDMKEGRPCIVEFDVGGEGIRPQRTIAVVRRVDDGQKIPSVAIEFEAPLETLGFLPFQLSP